MKVDHRGSEHFGKKREVLMHRQLGKWEMEDLIAAVNWLSGQTFVDMQRIGIRGSSYGGYVAAMALTFGAQYFTHGVALLSVTDWRYYDTFYTERYMDQPKDNPDGYQAGSVLTYTDQYQGHLLIVHGAMDDNVHYQNSVQLILELQKLNKPFELMIYPNQRHGVGGLWRSHVLQTEEEFWQRHFFKRPLDLQAE